MKKFPQFLKTMPEFFGIGLYDMPLIVIGLYLGMVFSFTGIKALIISLVLVLIRKLLIQKIDFVGFFLPRKKVVKLKVKKHLRGYDDSNIC
jgi:hypothetical protein